MDRGRRTLLLLMAGMAAGSGAGALARRALAPVPRAGPRAIRPPGARREAEFLAACIRCGQCTSACPYGSLELRLDTLGAAAATPVVRPRHVPCHLCADYETQLCIAACPTAALEPVADLRAIRMGTAVIDAGTCLAHNGVVCRTCWHVCPLPGEAIGFDSMLRPAVDQQRCIGCGLCEHACPTATGSIVVEPPGARS